MRLQPCLNLSQPPACAPMVRIQSAARVIRLRLSNIVKIILLGVDLKETTNLTSHMRILRQTQIKPYFVRSVFENENQCRR
jgi:hypothetical protein